MIDFDLTLKSDKILLRPLSDKDFEGLKHITSNDSMWTYFTSDLSDEKQLQAWVNVALLERSQKTRMPFVIMDVHNNKIIGSTSLGNISSRDKRIEIGWTFISNPCQGKAYNSQSKQLLLKYCFESVKFTRVEFKTDILNIAARKALIRIGAIEEGVLRSHTLMTKERRRDTIFYSILKSEWEKVKQKNNWM